MLGKSGWWRAFLALGTVIGIIATESWFDSSEGFGPGILFLKTHKTASSLMAAVLHRIAVNSRYTCAIPTDYGITWKFNQSNIQTKLRFMKTTNRHHKGPPFDMWVNHAVFSEGYCNLVPTARHCRLLSIVRHPGETFLSAWTWFKLAKYHHNMSIIEFADLVDNNEVGYTQAIGNRSANYIPFESQSMHFAGTSVLKDGFVQLFESALAHVRSGKWLVLLQERVDEGLLIFAKAYNLRMVDVLYINQFKKQSPPAARSEELSRAVEKLYRAQKYDAQLYEASVAAFERRVEDYGRDQLQQDLAVFRQLQQYATTSCANFSDVTSMSHRGQLSTWKTSVQCWLFRVDNRQFYEATSFVQYLSQVDLAAEDVLPERIRAAIPRALVRLGD